MPRDPLLAHLIVLCSFACRAFAQTSCPEGYALATKTFSFQGLTGLPSGWATQPVRPAAPSASPFIFGSTCSQGLTLRIGTDTAKAVNMGIIGDDRWLAPTATGMPALVAEGNIKPAIYGAHIANEKGEGPAASARLGWVHDEEGASYCILNGLTIDADERAGIRIHMRNTGSDVSPVNNDVGWCPYIHEEIVPNHYDGKVEAKEGGETQRIAQWENGDPYSWYWRPTRTSSWDIATEAWHPSIVWKHEAMPVVTWALGKGFATYKVGDFAAATANKGQAFLNPPGTAARPLRLVAGFAKAQPTDPQFAWDDRPARKSDMEVAIYDITVQGCVAAGSATAYTTPWIAACAPPAPSVTQPPPSVSQPPPPGLGGSSSSSGPVQGQPESVKQGSTSSNRVTRIITTTLSNGQSTIIQEGSSSFLRSSWHAIDYFAAFMTATTIICVGVLLDV